MWGSPRSRTAKGCHGSLSDFPQFMANHLVYLENNVTLLWIFVQRNKNQTGKSIWHRNRIWGDQKQGVHLKFHLAQEFGEIQF